MIHLLLFPVFVYLLVGLNFAVVLCLFAPRYLNAEQKIPGWRTRLYLLPVVFLLWPKYARLNW